MNLPGGGNKAHARSHESDRARGEKMANDLRAEYPQFFRIHPSMDHDAGWAGLLDELARRCLEADPESHFAWSKQKYGGLRVDIIGHGSGKLGAIIDDIESRSESICEQCGEPGILDDYAGFDATRCAEHGLELAIGRKDAAMVAVWERRKLLAVATGAGNHDGDREDDQPLSVGFPL